MKRMVSSEERRAIASNSYGYYDGPGYGYYDEGYYDDAPAVVGQGGGDDVGYCMQTYKSYNPRTGTYLGYDGLRHPCDRLQQGLGG